MIIVKFYTKIKLTMKIIKIIPSSKFAFLSLFFSIVTVFGQQSFKNLEIESEFKNYTQPYEEVMYAHINKAKFIKGETIGFTVYAFNNKNKLLSSVTSNIYCVITDKDNNVIKEQMVRAKDGIANGSFSIDKKFKDGNYNFKVFTN